MRNLFAMLGIVSLIGMVIPNWVILIDQIETEIANGRAAWDAVIVATEHRLRPILLTAAAAILGMIPISGPDGLRCDRWIGGVDTAYPRVPARAVCRLVQDQTGATGQRNPIRRNKSKPARQRAVTQVST